VWWLDTNVSEIYAAFIYLKTGNTIYRNVGLQPPLYTAQQPRNTRILSLRGSFEKFADSPYYSESEICGGAVTVSFSKYLPSHNAPFTCRKRDADRCSIRNFLPRSSLSTVGKAQKSHVMRSKLYGGCSNGVPPINFFQAEHRIQFRSRAMGFLGFLCS
jgi:hypothetical protein